MVSSSTRFGVTYTSKLLVCYAIIHYLNLWLWSKLLRRKKCKEKHIMMINKCNVRNLQKKLWFIFTYEFSFHPFNNKQGTKIEKYPTFFIYFIYTMQSYHVFIWRYWILRLTNLVPVPQYFKRTKFIARSTTMEPCVVWEFPSSPIGDPDCRDVIIEKRCVVGTQPTGNYAN